MLKVEMMVTEDFITEYETALRTQANAEITVKVLEMRAKLKATSPKGERKTRVQKFVEQFPDLEEETRLFLGSGEASTKLVSEFLDSVGITIHADSVGRKIGSDYKAGKHDRPGAKRLVCTISVVEKHGLNGTFQEE